jgi:hypothetical protein
MIRTVNGDLFYCGAYLIEDGEYYNAHPWKLIKIPGLEEPVIDIIAQDQQFVLTESGRLFGHGLNTNQQIGIPTPPFMYDDWIEINISNLSEPIFSIHANNVYSGILTAKGRLFHCGNDFFEADSNNSRWPRTGWIEKSLNLEPVAKIIPCDAEQVGDLNQKTSNPLYFVLTISGRLFSYRKNRKKAGISESVEAGISEWVEDEIPNLQGEPIVDAIIQGGDIFWQNYIITGSGRIFQTTNKDRAFKEITHTFESNILANHFLRERLPELLDRILNTNERQLDLSHLNLGCIHPKLIVDKLNKKQDKIDKLKLGHNYLDVWPLSMWEYFFTHLKKEIACLDLSGNEFTWILSHIIKLAKDHGIEIIVDQRYQYLQKYYLEQLKLSSQNQLQKEEKEEPQGSLADEKALIVKLNSAIHEIQSLQEHSESSDAVRKQYQKAVTPAIQLIKPLWESKPGFFKDQSLWQDFCKDLRNPCSEKVLDQLEKVLDQLEKHKEKLGKTFNSIRSLLNLGVACYSNSENSAKLSDEEVRELGKRHKVG